MQTISPANAIQLLHTSDTITLGFGPAFPVPFMEALGDRDDWQDLTIYAAILPAYYDGLSRPNVKLRSLFFGPVERHMQAIGADIHYIPTDLRRQALFAKKNPTRVFICAVSPPDSDGYVSLSANATQYEDIVACSQDPKRLLILIATAKLPPLLLLPQMYSCLLAPPSQRDTARDSFVPSPWHTSRCSRTALHQTVQLAII